MTETNEKPAEFVEALAKGIAILEAFDAANPEMTLSEVARRVGLTPAAARRSLMTLETLGYIGRRDKRFHLRPKLMALGSAFYFTARIDEVLQQDLRTIVDRFGDASSVGSLDGENVIYVAHVTVQRARRAAAVAGARYPAYATSMGRVLLAGLPNEKIDAYLKTYAPKKLTSKTCTNPKALRAEVMVARRDGYATTVDQLDYGITALAVPIRDADGKTVAALNTSGYTGMVTPEQLVNDRLPALREAASHISHQLNRYPTLRAVLGG
ncbi:IclR family transcriptional regulator C-terminal domain-containing protein [Marivita sp.]|uniref:IclR family transcriptional regulator domain-containing protein n=1 Tax=Marivita sp. TaxID=2003365 RepID=UPI0025B7D25D|nr:IclR family transcriptional regulator C-terminal domain-containing protein [Marivita sp.]